MYTVRFIYFFMILSLTSACIPLSGADDESVISTRTPKPSPSPTITVQWFPATPTPEPIRSLEVQATPDLKPGIGEEIFSDSFGEASPWNMGVSKIGSIALGQEDLTLAIAQPKGVLYSLRDAPVLDDFELSITSEASLCKETDQYGFLFRANSYQDYYRFIISCGGNIRLDRVRAGITNALINWTPSGQVPPGAPVKLRLGIWVLGQEMRFFINETFQFSAKDGAFPRGRVGVFARSNGNTAVTISFSNLVAHSLNKEAVEKSKSTPVPTEIPTQKPVKQK